MQVAETVETESENSMDDESEDSGVWSGADNVYEIECFVCVDNVSKIILTATSNVQHLIATPKTLNVSK